MQKKHWMFVLGTVGSLLLASTAALAEKGDEDAGESKAEVALKHRQTAPKDGDIDASATLDALLAKNGKDDWSAAKAARIEGYVITVEREDDGDMHLTLAATANEPDTRKWVIAEVTPASQKRSKALSAKSLRKLHGQKVAATGWLFWEPDTVSHDPRGTLWELHPITSITLVK